MTDKDILVLMLGHKSLAGKDTFFAYAKEYGFVRAAFADKLKSTVSDLYNFNHEQMHGSLKDVEDTRYKNIYDQKMIVDETRWDIDEVNLALDNGVAYESMLIKNPDFKPFFTPRRILQIFGQQQRALFPDIWAAYVFNVEIPRLVSQGFNKIVITDFRFKNEAKVALNWAKANPNANLNLIKINRPSVVAKTGAGDISENDLNDFNNWNYVLDNTSTLEDYKTVCVNFIESIVNR